MFPYGDKAAEAAAGVEVLSTRVVERDDGEIVVEREVRLRPFVNFARPAKVDVNVKDPAGEHPVTLRAVRGAGRLLGPRTCSICGIDPVPSGRKPKNPAAADACLKCRASLKADPEGEGPPPGPPAAAPAPSRPSLPPARREPTDPPPPAPRGPDPDGDDGLDPALLAQIDVPMLIARPRRMLTALVKIALCPGCRRVQTCDPACQILATPARAIARVALAAPQRTSFARNAAAREAQLAKLPEGVAFTASDARARLDYTLSGTYNVLRDLEAMGLIQPGAPDVSTNPPTATWWRLR